MKYKVHEFPIQLFSFLQDVFLKKNPKQTNSLTGIKNDKENFKQTAVERPLPLQGEKSG